MTETKIGQVLSSSPNSILVEIAGLYNIEKNKDELKVGRYLKISEGNNDFIIAVIKNVRGEESDDDTGKATWVFFLECHAVGVLIDNKRFKRGSTQLPVPSEPVHKVDDDVLKLLFQSDDEFDFSLGKILQNNHIDFKVDGDKFFGKHIAVVGSTGSGKSCCVAKIIQDVVGISQAEYSKCDAKNNSHVILFDIHDEYRSAFTLDAQQRFTLNLLSISNLKLPYWLMNSEELESIFIESNEQNSHNQVSQFKQAVILNKEKYNPAISEITYDTPAYFSIQEVYHYIENMNREMLGWGTDETGLPKFEDGTFVKNRKDHYFEKVHDFVPQSASKSDKAKGGPFNGDFNRFISRLETKLSDRRLQFLLDAKKSDGTSYQTEDFEEIVKQFLGYLDKANVTIVDLSGIPFEVLSITVSLISRIVFDFCFHYSKLQHELELLNDIPVMLVCEEAHNYVPKSDNASYRSSRKSIERIAKEGRKYGLSLMVVSQRPSEVSDTIFSQCNNFIALRLTNSDDQRYIKHLIPDNSSAITDLLPSLGPGECIVVGDAVLLPSTVRMDKPNPEPQSQNIKFLKEWNQAWRDISFGDVIQRWRG